MTRRNTTQREADLHLIKDLYLRQWSQAEIVEKIKEVRGYEITQQTVSKDLKELHRRWREDTTMDLDEAKQRELQRIDQLEREYWLAWEESKKDAETATQKAKGEVKEVSLQRRGQTGNPTYLTGVQWCIEQRCKILGINAPEKREWDGTLSISWQEPLGADDDIGIGSEELPSPHQTA